MKTSHKPDELKKWGVHNSGTYDLNVLDRNRYDDHLPLSPLLADATHLLLPFIFIILNKLMYILLYLEIILLMFVHVSLDKNINSYWTCRAREPLSSRAPDNTVRICYVITYTVEGPMNCF